MMNEVHTYGYDGINIDFEKVTAENGIHFIQFLREEGPKSHLSKTGTPSMGGIAIVFATILSAVMVSVTVAGKSSDYKSLIAILVVMVLFGLIGFIDDYEKEIKENVFMINQENVDMYGVDGWQ